MNAVELIGISKKYNIYEQPTDRLKELITRNRIPFHREFWALRDINLTFESGAVTGIIGLNGSGKSTILQIIANVIQPTAGEVKRCGRMAALLELGAGFQGEYTGRENALVAGMIQGISKEEMERRIPDIIDFAEIGDFIDQPTKTYSSGMYIRLAFAVSILVDPDILVVDEVLAVGDTRFQKKCEERISKMINSGKTIIFVTHSMGSVKELCNKAILLSNGKVVTQGSPAHIVKAYKQLTNDDSLRNSFSIGAAVPVA